MKGYIEIEDKEGKDCDICDLVPHSPQCQWPYCERNKVIFKKEKSYDTRK